MEVIEEHSEEGQLLGIGAKRGEWTCGSIQRPSGGTPRLNGEIGDFLNIS